MVSSNNGLSFLAELNAQSIYGTPRTTHTDKQAAMPGGAACERRCQAFRFCKPTSQTTKHKAPAPTRNVSPANIALITVKIPSLPGFKGFGVMQSIKLFVARFPLVSKPVEFRIPPVFQTGSGVRTAYLNPAGSPWCDDGLVHICNDVCMYQYRYLYVHMYACTYLCTCVRVYVCTHVCMYACMRVCMCVFV